MRFLHHLNRTPAPHDVCAHVNIFQWIKWLCLPLKCLHNDPPRPPAPGVGSAASTRNRAFYSRVCANSAWPLYVVSLLPDSYSTCSALRWINDPFYHPRPSELVASSFSSHFTRRLLFIVTKVHSQLHICRKVDYVCTCERVSQAGL